MVSEIREVNANNDLFIAEFGVLSGNLIDFDKHYIGRIYRLSNDAVRLISESLGFTANFESPSIHSAFADVIKTEGKFYFDIDRNIKPTDLNLRYARDRWSSTAASAKERDSLRPWIKSQYVAQFLPERVIHVISEQLKLKPEEFEHFVVRINVKDKTAGLIAEDKFIEEFPTGAFQVFALPEGNVASIPAIDLLDTSEHQATKIEDQPKVSESDFKYATYSKSEVDRMMKQQSENITSALSAKISGHQRNLQEAIVNQEKLFAKLLDKLALQIDESLHKLDSSTTVVIKSQKQDQEQFRAALNKDLEHFHAHINKNVIPLGKTIEEQVRKLEVLPKVEKNNPKVFLWLALLALALLTTGSTAFLYLNVHDINNHIMDIMQHKIP